MNNKYKQFLQILKLEPNTVFKIIIDGEIQSKEYMFDSCCRLYEFIEDNRIQLSSMSSLNLLNDNIQIFIPCNLTANEKAVINYVKACGFRYLAKDSSGEIYMYIDKPKKDRHIWTNTGKIKPQIINCDCSFLSWEDNEPFDVSVPHDDIIDF